MKRHLRHVVLVGLVASFVFLYLAAVTIGSGPLAIAALAFTAIVCVTAALAF